MKQNLLQIHIIKQCTYRQVWDYQEVLMHKLIQTKRKELESSTLPRTHHILFCEHLPVYTLGKSGSMDNLLISQSELDHTEFEFFKINRGGDITYHGPGQWTIYPIIDLEQYYRDVHKYVRNLEEIVIKVLKKYQVEGGPVKDFTGVWVGERSDRKICAIGVHLSRWVSMHGLALNVNPDLNHFKNIVPCGIPQGEKTVTSISEEVGRRISMEEVQESFLQEFINYFPADIIT